MHDILYIIYNDWLQHNVLQCYIVLCHVRLPHLRLYHIALYHILRNHKTPYHIKKSYSNIWHDTTLKTLYYICFISYHRWYFHDIWMTLEWSITLQGRRKHIPYRKRHGTFTWGSRWLFGAFQRWDMICFLVPVRVGISSWTLWWDFPFEQWKKGPIWVIYCFFLGMKSYSIIWKFMIKAWNKDPVINQPGWLMECQGRFFFVPHLSLAILPIWTSAQWDLSRIGSEVTHSGGAWQWIPVICRFLDLKWRFKRRNGWQKNTQKHRWTKIEMSEMFYDVHFETVFFF